MFRYLVLLGVVGAVVTYFVVLRPELAKTEEDLATIATQIAGRPVSVDCQGVISHAVDVSNNEGQVQFNETGKPADTTELKRDVCKRLGGFQDSLTDERYQCLVTAQECARDIERNVLAIHTLSHESWHLAGVKDERVTECYAMQSDEQVALQIGAHPRLARAIAVYYATRIYPELNTLYRSNSCKNGGPYDLKRGTRAWP